MRGQVLAYELNNTLADFNGEEDAEKVFNIYMGGVKKLIDSEDNKGKKENGGSYADQFVEAIRKEKKGSSIDQLIEDIRKERKRLFHDRIVEILEEFVQILFLIAFIAFGYLSLGMCTAGDQFWPLNKF